MNSYSESELILNPDGSIFHLQLFPEQISDNIILVGDPDRVDLVGQFLNNVERLAMNREFVSISGNYHGKKITVVSTGIGTDNIDIVVNEIDALANINLALRRDNPLKSKLNLIRIGTSGALQPELQAGTFVASAWSLGLDGLMRYYDRPVDAEIDRFETNFRLTAKWPEHLPIPYAEKASSRLLGLIDPDFVKGITVTAHGFYGPQGRQLRAKLTPGETNACLQAFQYGTYRTTNFEMETSALYGLGRLLHHEALTVCLIIANRITGSFLGDYKSAMKNLIKNTLDSIMK
jgi:uridine phosphorylase